MVELKNNYNLEKGVILPLVFSLLLAQGCVGMNTSADNFNRYAPGGRPKVSKYKSSGDVSKITDLQNEWSVNPFKYQAYAIIDGNDEVGMYLDVLGDSIEPNLDIGNISKSIKIVEIDLERANSLVEKLLDENGNLEFAPALRFLNNDVGYFIGTTINSKIANINQKGNKFTFDLKVSHNELGPGRQFGGDGSDAGKSSNSSSESNNPTQSNDAGPGGPGGPGVKLEDRIIPLKQQNMFVKNQRINPSNQSLAYNSSNLKRW